MANQYLFSLNPSIRLGFFYLTKILGVIEWRKKEEGNNVMTISGVIAIQKRRERINKLEPIIKEILRENQEGLNLSQIIRRLVELKKYSEWIKGDVQTILQAEIFLKDRGNKKIIIYRIKDS